MPTDTVIADNLCCWSYKCKPGFISCINIIDKNENTHQTHVMYLFLQSRTFDNDIRILNS